uniref:SDR family oxidoreductase n=3 Tax=unclassified Prevotella TaxID=2638335 RepID=A0AB33ITA0_9BACT
MENRRIFITGGAHGIGRALVEAFCHTSDKVAFCDIGTELGKEVAVETGAKFFQVDVTDKDALEDCMVALFKAWGDLDVIVNNVGIGIFKDITEVEVEEFDSVIATNLRSAFITSRLLARHRTTNGNTAYGRIVNLSSSRYLMSESGTEAYSASKGGIYSLTHALAISLAPYHITVNAIAPGWIHVREDEELRPLDHEFHPSGRVGEAEDIARACLFLCEEQNNFINGQTITIDGGVTRKMIYPE